MTCEEWMTICGRARVYELSGYNLQAEEDRHALIEVVKKQNLLLRDIKNALESTDSLSVWGRELLKRVSAALSQFEEQPVNG